MMMVSCEALSERVGCELRDAGMTIACAESCTGGLLTSTLTDISGSSAYVMGSVVSYSNDVKCRILHVQEETLSAYGAVSEETAFEMAEGIRNLMQTDIGIGITGIAGPYGGSADKPVALYILRRQTKIIPLSQKIFFLARGLRINGQLFKKRLHWYMI